MQIEKGPRCGRCRRVISGARRTCLTSGLRTPPRARVFYACTCRDAAAIGLDDDFIYEELPREIAARALPMEQLERDHSLELIGEWVAKPDKVRY